MFLSFDFMNLASDINLMNHSWYVDFQVKRSKVKITWVVRTLCHVPLVALCLFGQLISNVVQTQPKRGQRSRSHSSFKIFVMCAQWPWAYLIDSLHTWHKITHATLSLTGVFHECWCYNRENIVSMIMRFDLRGILSVYARSIFIWQ